jgi:hypothetical protein
MTIESHWLVLGQVMQPLISQSVADGALTVWFAATSPEPADEASQGPDRVYERP